jgi:NADH-quinone oxidoreductase subunit J
MHLLNISNIDYSKLSTTKLSYEVVISTISTNSISEVIFPEIPLVFAIPLILLFLLTALGTLISKNTIYGTLFLVVHLLCVSGFFALLGATFLATVQIVVYAGAIVVLFLFMLMLLNIKEEQFSITEKKKLIFSLIPISVLFVLSFWILFSLSFEIPQKIGVVEEGSVKSLGKLLFTEYSLVFELSSLILIGALVGAVMVAKKINNKK